MSNNSDMIKSLETKLTFFGLDKAVEYIEQHSRDISSNAIETMNTILSDDYVNKYNNSYNNMLSKSGLKCKRGILSEISTGNGRRYNDNALEQIKDLSFIESKKNVCVFGESGAGKSYLVASIAEELSKRLIRNKYTDYISLMDTLTELRKESKAKYEKKIEFFAKIPVLILDDFLADEVTPDEVTVMFTLIKRREIYEKPTIVATQYDPEEWVELMTGVKKKIKGEADSIRRRLVDSAYLITIEKL